MIRSTGRVLEAHRKKKRGEAPEGCFLALTTGGPEDAYRKGAFNGDIAGILRPIHRGMLQFVGFEVLAPQIVYAPVRMNDEQRKQALAAYAERLRRIDHESPIEVGIY